MITRKNAAFVAKIVNTLLTKIFMAIFALDERLPNFATLLAGLLFLHTREEKVCKSHHPIKKLSSTFWQHFFCISNVEVVEYIHKEHRYLTWRVLVHMPVHYPPIRGIVCEVTSVQNKHRKNYKRCIVQKMFKGCTCCQVVIPEKKRKKSPLVLCHETKMTKNSN